MGIVLFIIYLILCAAIYCLFLFIFRVKYARYYKKDICIDSDNESYAVYEVEDRRKPFISEYVVYTADDYRFLKMEITEKVEYININIICYEGKRIKKIINFLNEVDSKQDHYIIKLPDNIDGVRLNVTECNGQIYGSDGVAKKNYLIPAIISSVLMGLVAFSLLFAFRACMVDFHNDFFDWDYVYRVIYFEPWIYVIGAVCALVFGVLMFLILFIPNSKKYEKAQFNKIKKLNIEKVIRLKLKKVKTRQGNFLFYVKPKCKRKYKLKSAKIIVPFYDADGNLLGTSNIMIKKRLRKYFLTSNAAFASFKPEYIAADFKKIYFKNGTFRRRISKKGVYTSFLQPYGVKKVRVLFIVACLVTSAYSIYTYFNLASINTSMSDFEFVYADESTKDAYAIAKYNGKSSKLVIPESFNDLPIVKVNRGAVQNNLYVDEVYFSGEIEIEPYAFTNSYNIKKVDFTNVTIIGEHAFSGSRIREVIIDHEITIEDEAFRGNQFLRKVIINADAGATIESNAFGRTEIDYLEIHPNGNYISKGAFLDLKTDKGYIFQGAGINYSNYMSYVVSKNVKCQNTCVHDNNSFFVDESGHLHEDKSFTVKETIREATCVSNGINEVTCNYCGSIYNVGIPADKNKHDYGLDGNCIHCGRRDPNYVEPVIEEGDE